MRLTAGLFQEQDDRTRESRSRPIGGEVMDSWCRKYWDGKKWIWGAPAREARIKAVGGRDGVDRIILDALRMRADIEEVRSANETTASTIRKAKRATRTRQS